MKEAVIWEKTAGRPGPTVWVTAGLHGDEPGGVVVAGKIIKYFQKNPLLRGRLFILPAANVWGLKNKTRFFNKEKEDLNRSFPGRVNGSPAQKAAWAIFREITAAKPDLIIDLHNDWPESIPYLVLEAPEVFPIPGNFLKTTTIAKTASLIIVREKNSTKEIRTAHQTLSGALTAKNFNAFVLELGEYKKLNPKNIATGVRAVKNILVGLKMISGRKPIRLARIFNYGDEPKAPTAGSVKFSVKAGQKVRTGQKFAVIEKDGIKKEMFVSRPAIVLGLTDRKKIEAGEEIIALAEF